MDRPRRDVPPNRHHALVDFVFVAFHTDSEEHLERARSRLDDVGHLAVIEVDSNGRTSK